jgi:hypothetical protein
MGGPGSGRRPWRLAVDECRALAIGELADGGRWRRQPQGEVLWRARDDQATLARLSYVIRAASDGGKEQLLAYRYRGSEDQPWCEQRVALACRAGQPSVALCPGCAAPVRSLYVTRAGRRFLCRRCLGLVYRRSPAAALRAYVVETAGPVVSVLLALPAEPPTAAPRRYVAGPPPELAEQLAQELPLAAQELRLWVLRLRACGLSYRQIAPLVESSRSSVARICAAGQEGIDTQALVRETLARAHPLPVPPQEDDDLAAIDAYLAAAYRHARRLALYRHPLAEREERIVIPCSPLPGGDHRTLSAAKGAQASRARAANTSPAIFAAASPCSAGMACE